MSDRASAATATDARLPASPRRRWRFRIASWHRCSGRSNTGDARTRLLAHRYRLTTSMLLFLVALNFAGCSDWFVLPPARTSPNPDTTQHLFRYVDPARARARIGDAYV